MTEAASSTTPPWHASLPAPQRTAPLLTRDAALSALNAGNLLLVDVRRTDYEGGTIKGSLNLPAHSFYWNRAALYDLCTRAGIKDVAFYCGKYLANRSMDLENQPYLFPHVGSRGAGLVQPSGLFCRQRTGSHHSEAFWQPVLVPVVRTLKLA